MLEFCASPVSDSSFLFTETVKHLKIPVGNTLRPVNDAREAY